MYRLSLLGLIVLICCLVQGVLAQESGEGLPGALKQEVRAPQKLPKGRYVPVRTWSAVSGDARHQTGHAVADAEAAGGRAWEAQVGKDSVTTGALIYGPYITLT